MTINIFFHENNSQRGVFYGSIRQTSHFKMISKIQLIGTKQVTLFVKLNR